MSELAFLLYGNPHPMREGNPSAAATELKGRNSPNYGMATERILQAAKILGTFTAKEAAALANQGESTTNRALVKLANQGMVEKFKKQTGGEFRGSGVWRAL